jgi:hypothetical protein
VTKAPRLSVALRLTADDLDPDAITALLGCSPTASHRKGDLRGKQKIPATIGHWGYSIDLDVVEWFDLDRPIAALLDQFSADRGVWDKIHSLCEADVFCGLFMSTGNQMGELSAATMKALGERGLRLTVDIYGP